MNEDLMISERLRQLISQSVTVDLKQTSYQVTFQINAEALLKVGNYWDLREGFISFCPKGKTQDVNPYGKWKRKNRSIMKTGRFFALLPHRIMKRIVNEPEPTEKAIVNAAYEILSAQVRSSAVEDKIYISGNISEVYSIPTDDGAGGILERSCMRPESFHACREFASVYDNIPGLKILYILGPEKMTLRARALLWRTDQGMFLDRIYADETLSQYIYSIAYERGWKTRGQSMCAEIPKMTFTTNVNIYQKLVDAEGAPYVDSFFGMVTPYQLTSNEDTKTLITLQSADGDFPTLKKCKVCGKWVVNYMTYYDLSDVLTLQEWMSCNFSKEDAICEECFHTDFAQCDRCGTYHRIEDLTVRAYNFPPIYPRYYTCYLCSTCIHELNAQICNECGRANPEDWVRCIQCGTEFTSQPEPHYHD